MSISDPSDRVREAEDELAEMLRSRVSGPDGARIPPAIVEETVVRLLALQVLARALAAVPMYDEAGDDVRRERVAILRDELGASIKMAAVHFGVTPRTVTLLQHPPDEARQDIDESVWRPIMWYLLSHFPRSVTAQQVRRELLASGRDVGLMFITAQLDLYCRLDFLEKDGRKYRARDHYFVVDRSEQNKNLELLQERLEYVFPLARSFALATPGAAFGTFFGEMDQECLVEFSAELQTLTRELLGRYSQKSKAKEEQDCARLVPYGGLVSLGVVPRALVEKKERERHAQAKQESRDVVLPGVAGEAAAGDLRAPPEGRRRSASPSRSRRKLTL